MARALMDTVKNIVLPALAGVLALVAALMGAGLFAANYAIVAALAAVLVACAAIVARDARLGTLATALAAAGSNAYLLYIKVVPQTGPALCTIDEVFECDSINSSPASTILDGTALELPITLIGLAFFIALAAAALSTKAPRLFQVSGLFALVNIVVSLYLGSVLVTEGKVCLFCVSIYIANLIILWAALSGLRQAGGSLFADLGTLPSSRSLLTISAGTVVVVVVGWFGMSAQKANVEVALPVTEVDPTTFGKLYHTPHAQLELDGTEPVEGNPNAPYMVVEFADFACPHCKDATLEFKQALKSEPDLQLRFKVFPLTSDCNPVMAQSSGPARCFAAMAAECAGKQGKFFPYIGAVYNNQQELFFGSEFDPADLRFLAETQNLDVALYESCMQQESTLRDVVMDAQAGALVDVRGTPTFFLKGTHGDQWVEIAGRVSDIVRLVQAHKAGVELPPPGPRPPPAH
jgi:protein-disulfide isomerase/uncharacterized membrane protein